MATLIQQMHRKSLCRHDGYLSVADADVEALAVEVTAYCSAYNRRNPLNPVAFAQCIRQGSAQMFGIPLRVD